MRNASLGPGLLAGGLTSLLLAAEARPAEAFAEYPNAELALRERLRDVLAAE